MKKVQERSARWTEMQTLKALNRRRRFLQICNLESLRPSCGQKMLCDYICCWFWQLLKLPGFWLPVWSPCPTCSPLGTCLPIGSLSLQKHLAASNSRRGTKKYATISLWLFVPCVNEDASGITRGCKGLLHQWLHPKTPEGFQLHGDSFVATYR